MSKNRIAIVAIVVAMFAATACDPHIGAIPSLPELGGSEATTAPLTTYQHPNPDVERWHSAAIHAGWSEAQWPVLACVIQGESHGNPDAYNGRRRDRSFGLTQLNMKSGSTRTLFFSWGLNVIADLWDGPTNLIFAKKLYDYAASASWARYDGWQPWRSVSRHRRACFHLEGAVNAA